jgi:hypothetical protein
VNATARTVPQDFFPTLTMVLHWNHSALLDQALKVWNADESLFRNEIARTSFLKAKVLRRLGKDGLALTYHYKATTLRGHILKSSTVEDTDLVEDDFDRLVTFWSR